MNPYKIKSLIKRGEYLHADIWPNGIVRGTADPSEAVTVTANSAEHAIKTINEFLPEAFRGYYKAEIYVHHTR